jgi:hypothetical protein
MNVENNNVEGLYMAITCIAFHVFVLNVVVINSVPNIVYFSCDDNVMNLSYITIVPFCACTLLLEFFLDQGKK